MRKGRRGWWARQDSNLQPSRYERPALTVELQAPRCLRFNAGTAPRWQALPAAADRSERGNEHAMTASDDEIRRGKAMSEYLALSNQGTDLDNKGKVAFQRSPPDFSNVDLIAL